MSTPPRVCLFTGISGTLGQDFAARYGDVYEIIGVYNTTVPAAPFVPLDTAGRLEAGAIFGVASDLSGQGAVKELLDKVLARFESVDLLVNGAVYREFGRIRKRAFVETLAWQFYLNVCVPVELASALARRAWQHSPTENRERGRNIVNLSSTASHHVYPRGGQSGYGATKAALDTFTRHLAAEMAELGVRANAVAPNTFPGLVPTQSVSDAIRRYDQNDRTGDVLVIDTDGERLLAEGESIQSAGGGRLSEAGSSEVVAPPGDP
jgi:3-oxoacyl-[acyl-carrier protein] reductase